MSNVIFKSICLIFGTYGTLMLIGIIPVIIFWIISSILFIVSRLSNKLQLFSEWSLLQFLLTISAALGIPYLLLLASPGF